MQNASFNEPIKISEIEYNFSLVDVYVFLCTAPVG